ncbi:Peptidase M23 [Solidesulfovibrio carbinoliphilus subsp. oakridgensis]|uniref:Peptidase M23 n=1 Tax=Solidesulfovibrio carbinoliphilus subsp. oakridgensis TaxID=694327 RepID=G7QCX2_9BACT|nr:M23 family metallopeptidase [Solidesulfovibrio carbinoliphilus]EHJ46278.1 Peptidase M23 [Solidesulfovibrio carbinoliphilus subsp. oakridgensis]
MRRRALFLAAVMFLTGAAPAFGRDAARPRREDVAAARASEREAARRLAALWPGQAAVLAGPPDGGAAGADWTEADRRAVWMRNLLEAAGPDRPAAARDRSEAAETGRKPPVPAGAPGPAGAVRPGRAPQAPDQTPGAPGPAENGEEGTGPAVFTPPDGGLSWPIRGKVAAAFAPQARPPRQGVVLAAPPGSPVAAAAGGRVVFTGALRGLGRMLIVSHGDRRHTVYACLGQVDVAVDDEVPQGAILGRSGFCATARTAGVYFELRFREKALNPAEWLAARQ